MGQVSKRLDHHCTKLEISSQEPYTHILPMCLSHPTSFLHLSSLKRLQVNVQWWINSTEPERWWEQGRRRAVRPALPTVQHHQASIFFWQWSHWFHLHCVLLTTHQCLVSCNQTLITVFACHWYARWCFISIILFDNLELFKKRRERES